MIEFKPYIHHGKDLEEAVLGACMLEKHAFGKIYNILRAEMFYVSSHQKVFEAMRNMYENTIPIDIITVVHWITNKMGISDFNGSNIPYSVTRLTNAVVSSAHIEYHSFLIREMWERREVLKAKYSSSDETDPKIIADELNKRITEILDWEVKNDWYDMSDIIYNLIVHQADVHSGKKTFISTGFNKIDKLNGGFYNGQMIVIGARPAVGKSALMGKMAIDMAKKGKRVGIISLEMHNTEIAARLSSLETGIDFGRIFRDIMNDEDLHRRFYDNVSRVLVNLPIYVSEKTKVNINDIKAKAIKLKASKGCDCLMIDYLQLVESTTDNKNYNREQEVAKMSRGIKLMAMELDIPVIVLCQLNRGVTSRTYKDRFPKLSDLRESGAIEQDADVVMFLHRDYMSGWQTDEDNNSTEFKADLLAPKWRNGATFHLDLAFDPGKMKFDEVIENQFPTGNWRPVPELSSKSIFEVDKGEKE